MALDDELVWSEYASDAALALADIEAALLILEENPTRKDAINRLYRGLHTLKGNSGFLQLARIERLAHAAEDLIGLVRDHEVALDPELVDLMLVVVDRLREVVGTAGREHRDAEAGRVEELVAEVRAAQAARDPRGAPKASPPPLRSVPIATLPVPLAAPEPAPSRSQRIPTSTAPIEVVRELAAAAPDHDVPPDPELIEPALDPGYVEVYLSLVAESLPELGLAIYEAAEPAAGDGPRETLGRITEDLGLASERMGYVHVLAALTRLAAATAEGGAALAALPTLELELYAALVAVDGSYRSLVGTPRDFGIAATYRRACASAALADLARLRALVTEPAPSRSETRALFARIRAACEHHTLEIAAEGVLDHEDRISRLLEQGQPIPTNVRDALYDLLGHLGTAFDRDDEDAPQTAMAPPPPPTVALDLPLSPGLRAQVTPVHAAELERRRAHGHHLYELHAELERRPELGPALHDWLARSGSTAVTSAVINGRDGSSAYRFLVASPRSLAELRAGLAGLDAGGHHLLAHPLDGAAPLGDVAAPPTPPPLAVTVTPPLTVAAAPPAPPAAPAPSASAPPPPPGAIASSITVDSVAVTAAVAASRAAGQVATATPSPTASRAPAPADEPDGEPVGERTNATATEFLRIDARKVSLIMDLAGELGLASGAVTHHPDLEGRELEGFSAAAHKLEVLIRELQNEVSAMRLVPVAGVFQRMRRVVRDAGRRTGKKVELVLVGEDTEIDKVMVDALADPLVHLVRNSIDHGLETAEGRAAAGKPATGRLVLEASHQGGEVTVTVSDDGRGLDRDRILARAVERGLVGRDVHLPEQAVLDLVFQPGFSTKETIDELSGRGVGMDVVKSTVEGLRGRVSIRSTPGRGTRITLSVPLTLAFVEAMIVGERDRLFAVPIEKVFEVFQIGPGQIASNSADGQRLLRVRDHVVPVCWLHRFYGDDGCREEVLEGRIAVVVQTSSGSLAIPIDRLLGQEQIMLKPLSGVMAGVRAAAGCGMLRSGDVALALDCEQLHV